MIDVENEIFNAVYDMVAPLCAKNSFKSVSTPMPTAFPAVALFEMDNATDTVRRSTQTDEDYADLTYEAHIYATTKAESRKVFKALDDALMKLNMNRMSGDFTPSQTNTKVHEYVARYRVKVDQDGNLYRRR